MISHRLLFSLVTISLLSACGGGSSDSAQSSIKETDVNPPVAANSNAASTGQISSPTGDTSFSGNLLLNIVARDDEEIRTVGLRFSDNGSIAFLCASSAECGGTSFSQTVSGLNPGHYGALPGAVEVSLLVTDDLDQSEVAATLTIDWQPPVINNVTATRNAAGTEITVNWTLNPSLLRYNLYLASEPGVNINTYQSLSDGQALLAVTGGPQSFSDLSPANNYYVLLAGIDGSGESTNLNEIALLAGGDIPNTDPVANDDNASLNEDSTIVIDVLANDTDIDGDPITVTDVTAEIGSATIQADGILFEPPLNFNGETTLVYTISDGNGGTDSATVTVTVTPENDPPEATDDVASTLQDTAVNIAVLDNDIDPEGDPLSIDSVSGGTGTVTIEADNTLTYDPLAGFTGEDSFDYTITDGNDGFSTATVTVDVGVVSREPIATNDNYVALVDRLLTVDAAQGLMVNDIDPDDDSITVVTTAVRDAASGTLALSADGSFTYQPNPGFSGSDSFEYQVMAANGQVQNATASIEVRVIPSNLEGDSTSMSGEFLYLGQGEITDGSGRGSGRYRIGDCLQNANTRCHMLGEYVEAPTSGNSPNETGRYAFIQSYSGNGSSPVIAESTIAGGNSLSFVEIGDSNFELYLFPQSGGVIRALYPEEHFENSLGFGAFIEPAEVCVGLPIGIPCNIGQVGLVDGAQLTSPLDRLDFNQPGIVLAGSQNSSPESFADSYSVSSGDTLTVNAPGILANDSDPDIPIVGDNLQVRSQFSPGAGALLAIGFDEFRQNIYTTSNFGVDVFINTRLSAPVSQFPVLGELSNKVDIEITPESMQLAGVTIPQGTFLYINGETGTAEIYAVNLDNGVQLAQLNTSVGNGDVVGGAYNPTTQTLFLLQAPAVAPGNAIVSEINPTTGAILNQFSSPFEALDFEVVYGDIDVNNETGSLYIVGSSEQNILELNTDGSIVRLLAIPPTITMPSGLAVDQEGSRVWISSATGNVFELAFANQGVLPQLQIEEMVAPENGTLVIGRDGSFIYTPNPGFIGDDIFTYQLVDKKGKNSLNNVRITVLD